MRSIDITTTFEYDELGRVIKMKDVDRMITFTYGSTGVIYCHGFNRDTETTVKDKYYKNYFFGYKTVKPEYDKFGRVSSLYFPNKSEPLRVDYTYNDNNIIDSIRDVCIYKRIKRERVINDIKFTFDNLGRIVEECSVCDSGTTYHRYYSYIGDNDTVRHYIEMTGNIAEYSKQSWFDEYGNQICTINADSRNIEFFEYKYEEMSTYISTERHMMSIPPMSIQLEKIMKKRIQKKQEESGDEE